MVNGDIVSIEFTGKETASGKIFDTTSKDKAEKGGIYNPRGAYGPVVIIEGAGEILPGLEKAVSEMKEGEEKTITLLPADAFGDRNPELVRVLPLQEFKNHNISATPGSMVNVNDAMGKVQSVSGGRVRVDFNPELAGKTVEYDLKVVKMYKTDAEKLSALALKAFPSVEKPAVRHEKEMVELTLPAKQFRNAQQNAPGFAKLVLDHVKGTKKVVIRNEFEASDFTAGNESGMDEEHDHDHDHAGHDHSHAGHTH